MEWTIQFFDTLNIGPTNDKCGPIAVSLHLDLSNKRFDRFKHTFKWSKEAVAGTRHQNTYITLECHCNREQRKQDAAFNTISYPSTQAQFLQIWPFHVPSYLMTRLRCLRRMSKKAF